MSSVPATWNFEPCLPNVVGYANNSFADAYRFIDQTIAVS